MERNYNAYLLGMEKSKAEKLFFMNHLALSEFDIIIDFGCGAGEVIRTCAENSYNSRCYGIDKDSYMINRASENCKNLSNVIFVDDIEQVQIWPEARILLIFSSVLHEVNDYWSVLEKFIRRHSGRITVVVRDMCFPNLNKKPIDKEDLAKIIKHSNPKRLSEFVNKYGMSTNKDMYHYLLKYSYVDNWELELEEDYFSFNWSKISLYLAKKTIYDCYYTLQFKKDRVKKDFDIDLNLTTHRMLIVEV